MNLDKTFCSGLRCKRANTCERWIENLVAEAERKKIDMSSRRISIAEFGNQDGACERYVPKAEAE